MDVDWSQFDRDPEMTCDCRCGRTFRSHAKTFYSKGLGIITRKPCPDCGENNNIRALYSDPESFTVRG